MHGAHSFLPALIGVEDHIDHRSVACPNVAFEANHTEDRKLQNQLDALFDKLDGLSRGE